MAPTSRQQRKVDTKSNTTSTQKSKSSNNSNIWILGIAFAALILYVLYQSIAIYSKDRMYNDFE